MAFCEVAPEDPAGVETLVRARRVRTAHGRGWTVNDRRHERHQPTRRVPARTRRRPVSRGRERRNAPGSVVIRWREEYEPVDRRARPARRHVALIPGPVMRGTGTVAAYAPHPSTSVMLISTLVTLCERRRRLRTGGKWPAASATAGGHCSRRGLADRCCRSRRSPESAGHSARGRTAAPRRSVGWSPLPGPATPTPFLAAHNGRRTPRIRPRGTRSNPTSATARREDEEAVDEQEALGAANSSTASTGRTAAGRTHAVGIVASRQSERVQHQPQSAAS